MKNQREFLSYILDQAADDSMAVLCVQKMSDFFGGRRKCSVPTAVDSSALRESLATIIGQLSHVPAERIRIETTPQYKVTDGYDKRLLAHIDNSGFSDNFINCHLAAIRDGMRCDVTDSVSEFVAHSLSEVVPSKIPANALMPGERSLHFALLNLLALSAIRGHSGGFAFAQRMIDMVLRVNIIGRGSDGMTWRVVTA